MKRAGTVLRGNLLSQASPTIRILTASDMEGVSSLNSPDRIYNQPSSPEFINE